MAVDLDCQAILVEKNGNQWLTRIYWIATSSVPYLYPVKRQFVKRDLTTMVQPSYKQNEAKETL